MSTRRIRGVCASKDSLSRRKEEGSGSSILDIATACYISVMSSSTLTRVTISYGRAVENGPWHPDPQVSRAWADWLGANGYRCHVENTQGQPVYTPAQPPRRSLAERVANKLAGFD